MSFFQAINFDWQFSNPKRQYQDGCVILTGPVIIYSQADLDALFALYRPVARRVAGDPQTGGTVYVDHWGPDPSGPLLTGTPTMSYQAILSGITRTQWMPGDIHFGDLEFTLLDAGVPYP